MYAQNSNTIMDLQGQKVKTYKLCCPKFGATKSYIIYYQKQVIRKHIPDLPVTIRKSIKTAVEDKR